MNDDDHYAGLFVGLIAVGILLAWMHIQAFDWWFK